jgi:hypothetical protein
MKGHAKVNVGIGMYRVEVKCEQRCSCWSEISNFIDRAW